MENYSENGLMTGDQYPPVQVVRREATVEATARIAPAQPTASDEAFRASLKEKYGKVYRLEQQIIEDDDHDRTVVFFFKRPTNGSFDRYAKTMGQSAIRASKAFLLDCVVPEYAEILKAELEENPGMAMSISAKLTDLLGMSNGVNLKLL